MTRRHAVQPYNPEAARWWHVAEVVLLLFAFAALGFALGMVYGDFLNTGRWQVTVNSAGVAFIGVPLGVFAAVAHALRVHAEDGPPMRIPEPWHPTSDELDDDEEAAP